MSLAPCYTFFIAAVVLLPTMLAVNTPGNMASKRNEPQTRFELTDPALEARLTEIELLPAALLRSVFNGN